MNIINLIVSLIPVAGQTASEVTDLIASIKAAAAAHGYDLDTQALTAQHADAVRGMLLADAEVKASEPPTA